MKANYAFTHRLSFLNLALITFFALRYSPLSFMTGYSYERLIVLHRIAGYATIFWAVFHTILFCVHLAQADRLEELKEAAIVVGDVATLAMLIILGTALALPRMPYEAFYMVHIVMFVLILITLCFHPDGPMALGSILVVVCTAAFWLADYMIRLLQLLRYSVGNSASISPLPNGGIRVVMRKSPKGLVGGAHCSLWIPSVRLFETHPLAILSTNPLEFVLASYDGFTGDLYQAALQKTTVWASVHGPYGASLDISGCDKVVFIAGGSGASFTFALATELLKKVGDSTKPLIEFVWVIRQQGNLDSHSSIICLKLMAHVGFITWYAKELEQLASSPLVRLTIHQSTLTDATSRSLPETDRGSIVASKEVPTSTTASLQEGDVEKYQASSLTTSSEEGDVEKNPASGVNTQDRRVWKVQPGRPDIAKIIDNAVAEADLKDRLVVAACGPEGLMKTTRQMVSKNTKPEGPSIELQCEEYSW